MDVTKINEKKNILELEFKDVSPAQINTLRRLVISEVPTLAIEICEFTKNSSALYDEMLALRLGLIPLITDLNSYSLPTKEEKSDCEYNARSSVKGVLNVKGPCIVLAKDIKFKDPKVKAVYPEMIIAKLLDDQEIEVELTAVLGKGKEHTKWTPCLAYYHEIPEYKGKSFPVTDERGAIKSGAYKGVDEKDLKKNTNHYYFKIESWGQLKPINILESAINQFNIMLDEFEGLID